MYVYATSDVRKVCFIIVSSRLIKLYVLYLRLVPRPEFKQAARFGGGVAFSAMSADVASGSGQQGPLGQVRSEFPETWLWRSGVVT